MTSAIPMNYSALKDEVLNFNIDYNMIKPERPKVRYFLDEQELSPSEVARLHLEKSKSVDNKIINDSSEAPVKPVRPSIQYR